MAFLLITPSITAGYERVFGLVTVWAHPCQAHYSTLVEAACKLMLLVDRSADWVYAFVQLNEGQSHTPLSSEGHVSILMDGAPSTDAHSCLHQLQVCKLLQHKDLVVCPEGLNSKVEALQFTFQELPLWDAATPSKPTHELQLTEVDLSSMQPESVTTTIQTPHSTPVLPPPTNSAEPSGDITTTINLQLMGAMEPLQQASLVTTASISWQSTPGKQPPSPPLGALPAAGESEDPLR